MRRYLPNTTWVSYLCQQDHEGSVTHLLDFSGNVIESYQYDAFGKPVIYNAAGAVIASTAYSNRFMFTGREWAQGSLGFYEYRARAYHPGLGRFLSEDRKGFDAGDYNLFRYCHNDPTDLTDPMGLWGVSEVQSSSGDVTVTTQEIRQVVTGSWIPQVVGTQTTLSGSHAAVQVAVAALFGQGGINTVAQISQQAPTGGTPGNSKSLSGYQITRYVKSAGWVPGEEDTPYVRWQGTVYWHGKAVGLGFRVDENVNYADSKFAPLKGPNISHTTDAFGHFDDTYKFKFSSPNGYVVLNHEYMIGNARGQWPQTRSGANGEITPGGDRSIQTMDLYYYH
jgi:RHS repeat-associated protein